MPFLQPLLPPLKKAQASWIRQLHVQGRFRVTRTPKVCRIMAFWAILRGLGLLFYLHLGFRVSGLGFSVQGVGFQVLSSGFRAFICKSNYLRLANLRQKHYTTVILGAGGTGGLGVFLTGHCSNFRDQLHFEPSHASSHPPSLVDKQSFHLLVSRNLKPEAERSTAGLHVLASLHLRAFLLEDAVE